MTCVGDESRRLFVWPMACETGLVGAVRLGDLSFGIARVHRVTAEAGDSLAATGLDETRRPQEALILVGGEARRAVRPEARRERVASYSGPVADRAIVHAQVIARIVGIAAGHDVLNTPEGFRYPLAVTVPAHH